MTEQTTLGLPWPWVLKKHLTVGDRFFFFSVSPCTFAIGGELLKDGFILLLGPMNIGWASISSFKRREAQAIEAQRAETGNTDSVHESAVPEGNAP